MNSPPSKRFDYASIKGKWSDEKARVQRSREEDRKVRSIKGNSQPLRAGDHVLNQYGDSTTVSWCFFKDSVAYGITVGHLLDMEDETGKILRFGAVGDKVYAYLSDRKDDSGNYPHVHIGWVTAIVPEVDACVFRLKRGFHAEDCRVYLHPQKNSHCTIDLKATDQNVGPVNTVVAGFGAQRRGAVGRFKGCYGLSGHRFINQNDMRITSFDPASGKEGQVELTDSGDCGMLWVDEYGNPYCMHRAIVEETNGTYNSYGTPFHKILEAFPQYFSSDYTKQARSANPRAQLSPPNKKCRWSSLDEWRKQSSPAPCQAGPGLEAGREMPPAQRLKFDTAVVEAPRYNGVPPYRQRNVVKMNIVEAPPYSGVIPDGWQSETQKETL